GLAADHRLSRRHHLRGGDDRVDAVRRVRRVPTLPPYEEPEAVGRGHRGALAHRDGSHVVVAREVQTDDVVDADAVERTVVEHRLRTAHDLLGRLEHEHYATR